MTIGIYRLVFKGTNKIYIGQSTNIERRLTQHLSTFKSRTHSKRLMCAYDLYGLPTLEIVLECAESELIDAEIEAIEIFDSITNGFNTKPSCSGGGSCEGSDNANSLYSEEQVVTVMRLLIGSTDLTQKEISTQLNVGLSFVEHVSAGNTGKWLKDKYPEEYERLQSLKNNRDTRGKLSKAGSAKSRGIIYPQIIDPEGNKFTVDNIRKFGRDHSLNNGDLCQVLNGRKKSVKGWHL